MDAAEALRSIRFDLLEYIQEKVIVDFDNDGRLPVEFARKRKKHNINKVIGFFRTRSNLPINAFLVKTGDEEVYFLYFHFMDSISRSPFNIGCWVLSFRILHDHELMALYRRERKMLLNMTLKRVVDFHGHLCPELVVGAKVSEYAQKLLPGRGFSLIAENSTSAIDAIQILLGITIGNQRLKVMDFGKHNYTFTLKDKQKAFMLSLKKLRYNDGDEYRILSNKIRSSEATIDEVVDFQRLLDHRSRTLLELNFDELFDLNEVEWKKAFAEMPSLYCTCLSCGQEVLADFAVEYHDNLYCMRCFQQINTGCARCSLH
ncbi:formylmethanofuran dehydrogenase subunit E [Desulfosarcina sp. BuS5]|uniref:formylmethanofuran dehydrogenase subunit E family protein n=1 Tax=Desulfosarcina sp. BuS5 TaxID=933262 RepID=UPI002378CF66|nr:formylmethanofuran dehydrogenase subunit E family protein [Desulfosarcina sp. BuS5]WDN88695.1 formylmethanofuran dehydrogenase subunit E [Desulfosarcina sp. BuS5]